MTIDKYNKTNLNKEVAMVRIEELKSMSIEELTELRKQIEDVINQKKSETQKEYKIEVSLTADPRKWFPYVAKLSVASDSLEKEDDLIKKEQ